MQRFSPASTIGFLELMLRGRIDRARNTDDRGASAVEWVVISAIVVAIALAVGLILQGALEGKADQIGSDIDGAGG
jgi:Flp pilus assembly pilin Flp